MFRLQPGSRAQHTHRNRTGVPCGVAPAAAAILYTLLALCVQPAQAQDAHSRWHSYYQHWKVPGTWPPVSCCNARVIDSNGATITGDCEPTRAEIRNGEWYFWLRQENRWVQIPDSVLVRERNPSSEEGHICYSESSKKILCAVPPDTGG